MKITALKEHKCYCCGATIGKGETCFTFIVNPADQKKSEFDVTYTCLKCAEQESCRVKIKIRGASPQD